MKKTFVTILKLSLPLIYLLVAHRSYGQSGPMSMKQAIGIAIANNYSLKADSMNLLVTEYKGQEKN